VSGLTIREAVLRDARVYYERRLVKALREHRAAPSLSTIAEVERFEEHLARCDEALIGSPFGASLRAGATVH